MFGAGRSKGCEDDELGIKIHGRNRIEMRKKPRVTRVWCLDGRKYRRRYGLGRPTGGPYVLTLRSAQTWAVGWWMCLEMAIAKMYSSCIFQFFKIIQLYNVAGRQGRAYTCVSRSYLTERCWTSHSDQLEHTLVTSKKHLRNHEARNMCIANTWHRWRR